MASPAEALERRVLSQLGCAVAFLKDEENFKQINFNFSAWSGRGREKTAWEQALSRELLLLAAFSPDLAQEIASLASQKGMDLRPFPQGPGLCKFFGASCAATLIPLESIDSARPQFAQVWVFPECVFPDWREVFMSRIVETDTGIHIGPEEGSYLLTNGNPSLRIEGKSWQLAALLCSAFRKRLKEKNDPGAASEILRFAQNWVITGAVEAHAGQIPNPRVLQVSFTSKARLAGEVTGRNWLLPAANQPSIQPEWEVALAGRLHFARDLESAIAQVSGHGFQNHSPISWNNPLVKNPISAHCFASNALGPMLSAFLWSQPRSIKIWTSDIMLPKAQQLEKVCQTLRTTAFPLISHERDISIVRTNDNDLIEIRGRLLQDPSLGQSGLESVLFNITGGNLLMRLAILDLARLRPRMNLIYRTEDAENLDFVCLRHPVLLPVVFPLVHIPALPEAEKWKLELVNLNLVKRQIPVANWADFLIDTIRRLL